MSVNPKQEFPVSICEILQIIKNELGGALGVGSARDNFIEQVEFRLEKLREDRIDNYNAVLEFCNSYR